MAVFAERAEANNCWHVGCFVCEEDGEFLTDLVYCYKEGSLYCCRHWSEKNKPRCAGCEEVNSGKIFYFFHYTIIIIKRVFKYSLDIIHPRHKSY